jgi:hypothetical protein
MCVCRCCTRRIFNFLTGSTALPFTATGAPLAARRIRILPMNHYAWRPITFWMKQLQFTDHRRFCKCCPSTRRYISQLIVSLKKYRSNNPSCTYTTPDTNFSLDGERLRGLDVDTVNSSSDYFAYLYIPASETMLHQKWVSIADRSHLRRQTVETNCKN